MTQPAPRQGPCLGEEAAKGLRLLHKPKATCKHGAHTHLADEG